MLRLLAVAWLQAAPGASGPAAQELSAAFTALTEQGFPHFAAPATYRVVEVADCGPVAANTQHGWVSADGRTALTWGGQVLPVVKAGSPVSLEADVKKLSAGRAASALAVAVLQNQGTPAQVAKVWSFVRAAPGSTGLQAMASEWAAQLFERAVCAHHRSLDEEAVRLLETLESMTRRGLIERDPEAAALLADQRRRAKGEADRPLAFTASPNAADLQNWLSHLEDVGGQPPMVLPELEAENPPLLAEQPLVLGLARHGAPVAEQLIATSERAGPMSRFVPPRRKGETRSRIEPVSEVALAVLKQLFDPGLTPEDFEDLAPKPAARARLLRERWSSWRAQTPAERAVTSLERDDEQRWPAAARTLVQAVEDGDPALDRLRARKEPMTVVTLLAKRARELPSECELPKALQRWAPEAAAQTLREVLQRSRKYGQCLAWVSGALADAGHPEALDALADRLRADGSVDDEMVLMACSRPESTALARGLEVMLAERVPRLRWNAGRDWATLLRCAPFKAFVLRRLSDLQGLKVDGRSRRVADVYAHALAARFPSAPQFEADASQASRDAGLKAMREWLGAL